MVLTVSDECPEISQIINEHNQAELEKLFNEKCDVNKYVQSVAGNRVNHERALLLAVQEDWEEGVDILIKAGVNVCYRSGTVNSKSFVGKDFLRIKWKFELNSAL